MIQNRRQDIPAQTAPSCKALYIGPAADELCGLLAPHIGRVDIHYETQIQDALTAARRQRFDVALIDQRDSRLATQLILPLLSAIGYPLKLVVISSLSEVSHYLAIPGVARVLAAPVREGQLLRVLGVERRNRTLELPAADVKPALSADMLKAAAAAVAATPVQKGPVQRMWDWGMRLVSNLYKRAAFVLLFTLFVAFAFYGVLIGFFLLSSGWAAPLTLSRGHEMVTKAARELTEVQVALNQTEQRLQEAALAKVVAQRELEDAQGLVKYALGTVKREIIARNRQGKVLGQSVKRLKKVKAALEAQLGTHGAREDLAKLYKKRLIDKSMFNSGALGLLEASQRLAGLEDDIDAAQAKVDEFEGSLQMLASLQEALENGTSVSAVLASASDLLLLTKQASDALSARALATQKLDSLAQNEMMLNESRKVLSIQMATLKASPLVRAMDKRIDVLFVPYGNEHSFQPGSKLYACSFTVFWCHAAGTVGQPLPGEVSSVHPFFGKPIRGFFVEAEMTDPDAATVDVIHGYRKPFFL